MKRDLISDIPTYLISSGNGGYRCLGVGIRISIHDESMSPSSFFRLFDLFILTAGYAYGRYCHEHHCESSCHQNVPPSVMSSASKKSFPGPPSCPNIGLEQRTDSTSTAIISIVGERSNANVPSITKCSTEADASTIDY